MKYPCSLFLLVLLLFFSRASFAPPVTLDPKPYEALKQRIQTALSTADYLSRLQSHGTGNVPAPELGPLVRDLLTKLKSDPAIQAAASADRGFNALLIQTVNHLEHVSFEFEKETQTYTHDFVLQGAYPLRPTLLALEKASEFFHIASAKETTSVPLASENKEREKQLMDQQFALVKRFTMDRLGTYREMKQRLVEGGPEAKFPDELGPVVEFLELKLVSDAKLLQTASENPYIRNFRTVVLEQLAKVRKGGFPYLSTVDAIERGLEFLDVYHRGIDPSRSPVLYHSGRYEYYLHYLKGTLPDHIMLPTLVSLGATDILKVRGVPVGFVGVNVDTSWVDGFYQTPFEFYIHDVNHSRRMYLFFEELAKEHGMTIDQLAEHADQFVSEKLMPLIRINRTDSDAVKNHKRLIKVLLFEILHEDALAPLKEVIEKAVLREAGVMTPFEKIVKNRVVYVMEPGATTLSYVLRKLDHDFYDMPGERVDNIVAPEYRTRENIVSAAEDLFKALGLATTKEKLEFLVGNDEGLPELYRATIDTDRLNRPNETTPIIDPHRILPLALEELERSHIFQHVIDRTKPITIRGFWRKEDRVAVHLTIPVEGEDEFVDVQIPVPMEKLSVDRSVGTIHQIRGSYRIIKIRSGDHLKMEELESQLLSRLDGEDFLIPVRVDDPNAGKIIEAANRLGLQTLMLVSSRNPLRATDYSPTFFAVLEDQGELEEMWNKLAKVEDDGVKHLDLDFRKPLTQPLSQQWTELALNHFDVKHKLQRGLIERGIPEKSLQDYWGSIFKDKIPVLVSGASEMSWPRVTEANKEKVRRAIIETLDTLDPSHVVLLTGAMNFGVEKIVHEEGIKRGFKVLGVMSELADLSQLGPITHASILGNSWSGRSRKLLSFIKKMQGLVVFMGGGETIKEEIEMARQLKVAFHLMDGPEGSSTEAAKENSSHAFVDGDALIGKLFQDHPSVIRQDQLRRARDARFASFVRELEAKGITKSVNYDELKAHAAGRKVVVVGGYMGLDYENPEALKTEIRKLVQENGDHVLYVSGATATGIGRLYSWIPEIARELGLTDIKTAGFVSRNVATWTMAKQDYTLFIDTAVADWRGKVHGRFIDVQLAEETHGKMVFFNGGGIAGETAEDALSRGIPVELHNNPDLAPNSILVKARQASFPSTVVNGTERFFDQTGQYPHLKVCRSVAEAAASE